MSRNTVKLFTLFAAAALLIVSTFEIEAHARAGSSRSMGSRGSRSYSRPASPSQQTAPSRPQQATPAPAPAYQQPAGGGFLRSMAGGIAGGLLGGMLFRSLGMGGSGGWGGGGGGGGGIGIFEIILIAGIGYLIYRFIKNRRAAVSNSAYSPAQYQGGNVTPITGGYQESAPINDDLEKGLGHICQFDPSFDEERFNDLVMDNFFKIQGAWMNRDLAPVTAILTDEMRGIMQQDVDRLLRDRQINRLENIAVRNVEIVEAWQESGQDFISTQIYANLLDYTTDESTSAVLSGSKTEPVKFEEYWTFTRPVGNNSWKLSAIQQK